MSKVTDKAHPTSAHKYMRVKTAAGTIIWRCMKPGCSHYLRNIFIVGAVSECWRCDSEFVIDKTTALKKPHCRDCTRRKDPVELPPIEESPI